MKFFIVKILVIFLLALNVNSRATKSHTKSHSRSQAKAHTKTTYWVRPLIKTAKSYHSFANLAYCPGDVINQLGCPLCDQLLDNSFEVFKYYKHKHRGYTFTFVILYSVNRNEVVIALSGPRNPNPAFFGTIYARGFRQMKGHPDIKIENTYLDAYEGKFQRKLFRYIQDYNDKFNVEEKTHKYVFVGHNFGGSLATLAAFDMANKKVVPIEPELDSPIVYSYGALRIGNNVFVNQSNGLFKIVRIIKEGDLNPRMPSCTWSPSINRFRCEEDWDYSDVKHSTRPELLNYIQNYYGKGGLEAGIQAPFRSFLATSEEEETEQPGWSYGTNNPGYTVNNLGDPFDEHGRTSDDGKITYSQPLGAEVLFSNDFKKHTVCSYFYGIPNCEKQINPEYSKDSGKSYFNTDITDC